MSWIIKVFRLKQGEQWDPLEIVLALVFGTAALVNLIDGSPSASSTQSSVEPCLLTIWLVLLIIGVVLILVGHFSPRTWGYLLEQIGLAAMGGALIAFGAQVLELQIERHVFTLSSMAGGPLYIALGLGLFWKRHQVMQKVKLLGKLSWRQRE